MLGDGQPCDRLASHPGGYIPSNSHSLTVRLTVFYANSRSRGFASKSQGESESIDIAKQSQSVWRNIKKSVPITAETNLTEMPASFRQQNSTTTSINKVKNTLKQIIFHRCYHFTHIFENCWFEFPISRFFWALFPNLHICMRWGLKGLG